MRNHRFPYRLWIQRLAIGNVLFAIILLPLIGIFDGTIFESIFEILFAIVSLITVFCVFGYAFSQVFFRLSPRLMNISYLWDPQMSDLLTPFAKRQACLGTGMMLLVTLWFLLGALPIGLLFLGFDILLAWALWPQPQRHLLDLKEPESPWEKEPE